MKKEKTISCEFTRDELIRIWIALNSHRKYYDFTGTGSKGTKQKFTKLANKIDVIISKNEMKVV